MLTTLAIAVTAVATLSAAIKFTSTFKSMDAGAVSFAGKKVAALVISNDDSLRVAGEESLVRELSARGMQAVATYRIAPKEELRRAETARPWFEKASVEGVVVVRPVSADTRQTYTPGTWVSPNYGTLWGYYGYGWSAVYVPGAVQKETHGRGRDHRSTACRATSCCGRRSPRRRTRATCAGSSRSSSKQSVEEMQKQGLARRQPR